MPTNVGYIKTTGPTNTSRASDIDHHISIRYSKNMSSQQHQDITHRLHSLKELTLNATDLADIWDYFHDELVTCDTFMELGECKLQPTLSAIAASMAKLYLNISVNQTFLLRNLNEYKFWHGISDPLQRPILQILYFEDINRGLFTLNKDMTDSGTYFIRITIPEGIQPEQLTEENFMKSIYVANYNNQPN